MVINRPLAMNLGLAAAWSLSATRGLAQAFPHEPLRWLVGFPPGGGATMATRVMADWLSRRLGQPVLAENTPGASGNLALQEGAKAAPDGQTILLVLASAVVNRALISPIDGRRDFGCRACIGAPQFRFGAVGMNAATKRLGARLSSATSSSHTESRSWLLPRSLPALHQCSIGIYRTQKSFSRGIFSNGTSVRNCRSTHGAQA
jgi:hypothetical protein